MKVKSLRTNEVVTLAQYKEAAVLTSRNMECYELTAGTFARKLIILAIFIYRRRHIGENTLNLILHQ